MKFLVSLILLVSLSLSLLASSTPSYDGPVFKIKAMPTIIGRITVVTNKGKDTYDITNFTRIFIDNEEVSMEVLVDHPNLEITNVDVNKENCVNFIRAKSGIDVHKK